MTELLYAPLQIGDLTLDVPVVQAALSGYSDWPMRVMARRHGAPFTLCEVMLDKFLVQLKERKKTRHFLYISDEEHPVGGQLMGAEPEQFSAAAGRLVDAGFDVIDINFGCPVKKVLGKCRGGFHLGQPEVALEIIRRTRDVVPSSTPVTVKLRRGIDDSQQSVDQLHEILSGCQQLDIASVTVHGRTVEQRDVGPSNWDFLRQLKLDFPDLTMLGSGDLFTAADCLAMLQQTGLDGVSVARGAIGNPWIFSQVRALLAGLPLPGPPTIAEQRETLADHFGLARELYGDQRAAIPMRKFGIRYSAHHPQHADVRADFTQVRTVEDWQQLLTRWYQGDGPGAALPADLHKVQADVTPGPS
jgi:nifR3 family TIM-barrel protein